MKQTHIAFSTCCNEMSLPTLIALHRALQDDHKAWEHLVEGVTTTEINVQINVSIFQDRPFNFNDQTYRSAFVAYQAQKVDAELRPQFQNLAPDEAFKLMLHKRSHYDNYSNKYQLMHDIIKKQAQELPVMQTMLALHKDSFIHEDTHQSTYWKINLPRICAELGRHFDKCR